MQLLVKVNRRAANYFLNFPRSPLRPPLSSGLGASGAFGAAASASSIALNSFIAAAALNGRDVEDELVDGALGVAGLDGLVAAVAVVAAAAAAALGAVLGAGVALGASEAAVEAAAATAVAAALFVDKDAGLLIGGRC